jgi:hypothetical protein
MSNCPFTTTEGGAGSHGSCLLRCGRGRTSCGGKSRLCLLLLLLLWPPRTHWKMIKMKKG